MSFNVKVLSVESSAVFVKAAGGIAASSMTKDGSNNPQHDIEASVKEFVNSLPSDCSKCPVSTSAAQRVDDIEIATRSHVLFRIQNILRANASSDLANLEQSIAELLVYIRGAIDFCLFVAQHVDKAHKSVAEDDSKSTFLNNICSLDCAQFRKLPFLLMEDTVDTLPTSIIQIVWKYGLSIWLQSLLCVTTSPPTENKTFHLGSKYCLIRMCNRLLKNLSVDAHDDQVGGAEFAGEISMMLASVFPLSERSAVNVLGAFHVDNIVQFESFEEWMASNKDKSSGESAAAHVNPKKIALNYDLYSKFWGLQNFFTNPKDLVPKGNTASGSSAGSPKSWNDNMDKFFSHLEEVLEVFEGHPFSADSIKKLSARWKAIKKSGGGRSLQLESIAREISNVVQVPDETKDVEMKDANEDIENRKENQQKFSTHQTNSSSKYLTNSQLLHLQLQDPEIRIHFLSQVFIITAYLSATLTNYVNTVAGSTIPNKMLCEKMHSKINQLEKRSGVLLRQTPPNGEAHFKTLQLVVARESVWRNWKKDKCTPPIEKFLPVRGLSIEKGGNDLADKRRNLMGGSLSVTNSAAGKSISDKSERYKYNIDMCNDLPTISTGMSKQSGIDQFLDEYADALDPDAGIEEEYHPKNNKVSSWRSLRSLSQKHIGQFGDKDGKSMIEKKNGTFEGIVRKIWKENMGIDIPGNSPKAEGLSDDEVDAIDDNESCSEICEEQDKDEEMPVISEIGDDKKDVETSDKPVSKAQNDPQVDDELGEIDESVKTGDIKEDEGKSDNNKQITKKVKVNGHPRRPAGKTDALTPSADRKVEAQPSMNGHGTHIHFSTPARKKEDWKSKKDEKQVRTKVIDTLKDVPKSTSPVLKEEKTEKIKKSEKDGKETKQEAKKGDRQRTSSQTDVVGKEENNQTGSLKRKREMNMKQEETSKISNGSKSKEADQSKDTIRDESAPKQDVSLKDPNQDVSLKDNNVNNEQKGNSSSSRRSEQRRQETRQIHVNRQKPLQQKRDGAGAGAGGRNSAPPPQNNLQTRKGPPPLDSRSSSAGQGTHTRFKSPPPNTGGIQSTDPRGDDRGGPRGDDRASSKRGNDRGISRSDNRGSGPRGDYRGDNRGQGPRGDERGNARGPGPRGDEKGNRGGQRNQYDRRRQTDSGGRGSRRRGGGNRR